MFTSCWHKFLLLSWKNWLIQVRHVKQLFVVLLIPPMFVSILLLMRYGIPSNKINVPKQHYPGYLSTDMKPALEHLENNVNVSMVLAYSPKNYILEELVMNACKLLKGVEGVISNKTSGDLNKFLTENDIFCGIEFPDSYKNLTELPEHLNFSLRFPAKLRESDWKLNKKFAPFTLEGPRNPEEETGGLPPGYLVQGFTQVQSALSEAFIQTKYSIETSNVYLQRYPVSSFTVDVFWIIMGKLFLFPLIIILSLAAPAMFLVKSITLEKEEQLKETMKIMGLPNWLHWLSWFIKAFIQFLVITTIMTVMLKVINCLWDSGIFKLLKTTTIEFFKLQVQFSSRNDQHVKVSVLAKSKFEVIWILLMIYSSTTICFCFMISTLFSKSKYFVKSHFLFLKTCLSNVLKLIFKVFLRNVSFLIF